MRGSAAEVEWGTGTTFVCEKTGEAVVSLAARNRSRGLRAQQAGVACGIAAAIMAGVWWRSGMQPGALAGGTASAFAIALLLWRLASTSVIAESVLVLGEVGVQIATETRGGWLSKRLVDAGKVRAAIINEHVSLFGVHNYVGLIVDGLDHMEVLFPSFQLPIPLVEHACWSVSHVLLGEQEPPALTQGRFDQRRAETTWGGLQRAHGRDG